MTNSGSQHERSSDDSATRATGPSLPGDSVSAGKTQFSTDPHIPPDDQTVVAATPSAGGTAMPPKVPTSGDLGKMLVGERLGHFHLEEFVGGGGMGAVFRGTDEMLGRTVAIKVLSPQQGSDEETTRRFRHEAQSTARLDHDHIARVYYVGVDRGWHYIVLEYVEGENLRDLVMINGPLPFADVISYTIQISEALDHASGRDVVHRDIKPSNVLITRRKQAKLVDMGLARLHQVDNPEDDLTASGVTLGTFDYISPEQARDPRIADVRSDLYSLGCTVYFMLTGRPPFPQGTVLQKLLQHQGEAPPDPRRFRPDVPEAICGVTSKLLAKNPGHRYQHPQDLIHELLAVSRQLDLPLASSVVEEWIPQKSQQPTWVSQHLPWIVPVSILLAIVLFSYLRDGLWAQTPAPKFETGPSARASATGEKAALPSARPAKDVSTDTLPSDDGTDQDDRETSTEAAAQSTAPDTEEQTEPDTANKNEAESDSQATTLAEPDTDVIVVGPQEDADYKTLADACQAVGSSATIELRYNDRRSTAVSPIVLDNKQLTIRGGEGYKPVVHFLPDDADEAQRRYTAVQILQGRLTLVNIHLELTIPDTASRSFALFNTKQTERLGLRNCSVTVRDRRELREYDDHASVILASAASHQGLRPASQDDDRHETIIDIEDTIVRGEADFLAGDGLGDVTLDWQNGLLAVDDRFVKLEANQDSETASGRLQIHLEHVTANTRRGFCVMSGGDDARYFPTLKLDCVDSILVTAGAPLIEQHSWHRKSDLQNAVRWSGHNNLFDGFELFWLIDSEYDAITEQLDWPEWQAQWPMGSSNSYLNARWQSEVSTTDAISRHRVTDYQLETENNPAISGATDGMSDIGLREVDLPRFLDAPVSDVE